MNLFVLHFGLAVLVFSIGWALSVRLNFYSLVDVVWSYFFIPSMILYMCVLDGNSIRKIILTLLITAWSVRLGTHLLTRLKREFPKEDGRYVDLKTSWKSKLRFKFFIFYQIQALSVVILCLPFYFSMQNQAASFSPLEIIAVCIWVCGFFGESLADLQLKNFKKEKQNKGLVCDQGLWRYSRHPNYFFEWVMWVAYGVFSCASSIAHAYWGILSPVLMFVLLYFVSGVPPAERSSMHSKGERYKEYQKKTSKFFLWFRKA